MQMTKYRKKPIVVEAVQITYDTAQEIAKDLGSKVVSLVTFEEDFLTDDAHTVLSIHTLEGNMRARESDYIVKGIKGEFYPVKKDIFDATYEKLP